MQLGGAVTNTVFYGDNLDILRSNIPDASVDLIYLDPPFNSNRNYNVLFREKSGQDSPAQMRVHRHVDMGRGRARCVQGTDP
jgi:adenine specific DNA methylase Mod